MSDTAIQITMAIPFFGYILFLTWPQLKERIQQLKKRRYSSKKTISENPACSLKNSPHFIDNKPIRIYDQAQRLAASCERTKSNMVLIVYDNEMAETYGISIGNDIDLTKAIGEATDKNEIMDEFMQMIAKYYHQKYQS